MLRSLEYAIETACATQPELADELRVALDARGHFLDGYFRSALGHERPVVPAGAEPRRGWLRCLELEKALYELDYEANNRPAWAHIPARGILQLLKV
jgi:maltose alpha-D-glucosyltransferase/alpha-amylase